MTSVFIQWPWEGVGMQTKSLGENSGFWGMTIIAVAEPSCPWLQTSWFQWFKRRFLSYKPLFQPLWIFWILASSHTFQKEPSFSFWKGVIQDLSLKLQLCSGSLALRWGLQVYDHATVSQFRSSVPLDKVVWCSESKFSISMNFIPILSLLMLLWM